VRIKSQSKKKIEEAEVETSREKEKCPQIILLL
jgi:hypothetical protein